VGVWQWPPCQHATVFYHPNSRDYVFTNNLIFKQRHPQIGKRANTVSRQQHTLLLRAKHFKYGSGVKKKYLWFRFPTDPIFFLPTLLFFQRLTVRPYFLRVVAGCSLQGAKMASVVTLIIEPNCLNSSIGNTHL
jgi:hypothetical protein